MTSKQAEQYWLTEVEVHYLNKGDDPCLQVGMITAVGEHYILFHPYDGEERPLKLDIINKIKPIHDQH